MPSQAKTVELPDSVRRLLIGRIESPDFELPFLPRTASEVLALCKQDACDPSRLAQLVQRDVTLAAHVLRVSNSSAYAPLEPIVSLQQAISRLGMSAICEIAISASLRGRAFDVPGYGPEIQRMWRHAAASAVYAREVARVVRHNVEGAYMCGLLHDIGEPLVLQALVDVASKRTERTIPLGIVRGAMAEFHATLGARLAKQWSLSEWVIEAVAHHHDYARADSFPKEAMITYLADLLADWALGGVIDGARGAGFNEDPVVDELGLYGEDLERLLRYRPVALELAESFA
jgi:putative nucleotidyltransferase with HDIG domain